MNCVTERNKTWMLSANPFHDGEKYYSSGFKHNSEYSFCMFHSFQIFSENELFQINFLKQLQSKIETTRKLNIPWGLDKEIMRVRP